ncbi:MAG: hypothetical protein MMC33_002552 [Icmadophila ericetorum]|nr:hypothetical protein [Icmadophila ericetorum]
MTNQSLPTAQLAIYGFLSIPALYVLIVHGRRGLLGWIFLFAFCTLRVVGPALEITNPTSSGAAIISSIGLSPLILATNGVLHEARILLNVTLRPALEWTFVILFHILVTTGLALIAANGAALIPSSSSSSASTTISSIVSSKLTTIKVGILILLSTWILIVLGTLLTLHSSRRRSQQKQKQKYHRSSSHTPEVEKKSHKLSTTLLHTILLTLPFSGIRMIYSCFYIVKYADISLNPVTGRVEIRVFLSVLPEMIVVAALLIAGVMTRAVRKADGEGSGTSLRAMEIGNVGESRRDRTTL